MYNFDQRMGDAVTNTNTKGWLVSVLELGAWFGVLCTGYLADKLSRKYSIVLGQCPHCRQYTRVLTVLPQLSSFSASASLCKTLRTAQRPYSQDG